MHRTQILLEQPQYEFLIQESRRLGVSLSGLVRRLVSERMLAQPAPDDDLESIIGIGEGPGDHGGRDHNHFLYGKPRS